MANQRPNIILLISDEWRGEQCSYAGDPMIQAPCLDALAAEGAGFTKCYVQNPVSTPSRVTLASGRYAHVAGHRTMHHSLRAHEPNMLRTFKENGYFVWWGGKNDMIALECTDDSCNERVLGPQHKNPVHDSPWEPGHRLFHSFLYGKIDKKEYGMLNEDDFVRDNAVDFIRQYNQEKPMFMLFNQTYPHVPYAVDEPYFSMYDRAKVPFPKQQAIPFEKKPEMLKRIGERMGADKLTEDDWREIVAVYYGMISRVDDNFLQVINALKEAGMYENSLVILSSDHGDYVGDYMLIEKNQNTFEDVLVNVPLAIRAPKTKPLAGTCEALCQWIDILPTCLEYAGIAPVETHFGKSLGPLLRGETTEHRDYVFSEGGALKDEIHTHESARDPDQHYWPRVDTQFNSPETHGKAVMVRSKRYKYVQRLYDIDELYDLETDPHELVNRIDDEALRDVQMKLQQELIKWFIETGDAVPWRWNLRGLGVNQPLNKEAHPPWSADAVTYGTI